MDHHDRFREWLLAGARGEPARDMAVHASACEGCLADVAALDGLLAVNVGAADVPAVPVGAYVAPQSSTVRILRAVSGVTAVGLLVMAAMIGAGSLRDREGGPGIGAAPTRTPIGEGVLGGAAGPGTSTSPGAGSSTPPSARATRTPDESLDPGGASAGPTGTLPPFVAPPPPPITPGPTPTPPAVATPQPTAPPTAATTTTPAPTAQASPTPLPTVVPTPTPIPTPTAPATPTPAPPSVEPPPPSEAPAP